MADHPPPAASMATPMSPKRAQTIGNTPVLTGPVAQSSPVRTFFNAAAAAAATFLSPPPHDINITEPGSEPSAITTITKATPADTAAVAKRPVETGGDDESSAAPKKPKYADFTTKKSDDNSLMSAEDEAGWEKESDEMMQMAEVTRNNEDVAAENMRDCAVDLYNKFMNSVDIADQLRNNYRPLCDRGYNLSFSACQVLINDIKQ